MEEIPGPGHAYYLKRKPKMNRCSNFRPECLDLDHCECIGCDDYQEMYEIK